MVKRRRDRRIWYMILGVFVAIFLFSFLTRSFNKTEENVDAASLANFDPGNIISDYQMSNYKSMNESQIQAFLKSKNSCNDTNLKKYTSGEKIKSYSEKYPPYTWHVTDTKFICMADEKIGSETAARIIYQAAQDYKINPQVIIVLLQKEQGLVTDTFPNSYQYRSATGYGCPDTAACSTKYYGFKNQVRNAAAMFRSVLDGGWTNYPVGNNYIQYSPNAACGGSIVNIKNRATSALYRYTPYQPNKGALAAGYGTANCGAYGNRNFYLYFQDWFGGINNEKPAEKPAETKPVAEAEPIPVSKPKTVPTIEYATAEIDKKYNSNLGKKIGGVEINKNTGIAFQAYENGYIVGNQETGFFESRGKIRDVWAKSGYESGIFGFPTSQIYTNEKTGIIFQYYENGCIVGNEKLGFFESRGKIRDVWAKSGYESGSLGFPTSPIHTNTRTGITFQSYERGYIVGNSSLGFFESRGKIRDVWAKSGYESGSLGFPTSPIHTNTRTGITFQSYENGYIVGNEKLGFFESRGKIRDAWAKSGYESGSLGFPTSGITNSGVYQIQKYQRGTIKYNTSSGRVSIE